jgi:uncharacterized protein (TIGR01777 family)
MLVFVVGGTGFIGRHLVGSLAERGDECVVLSRGSTDPWGSPRIRLIAGDPTRPGDWQREVADADAVINLAGTRIVDPLHRWTDARKQLLTSSRVETTKNLVAAIRAAPSPPSAFLSGSAIGYYGARGDAVVDEREPAGEDFLATLSLAWERAALEAEGMTRVTLLRTGLVLGRGGGVLDTLMPLFKAGLGGPWGSGRQWWSWIHLADEVGLVLNTLDQGLGGPINLTAPNPVTVAQFAAALGRALGRPAILPAPGFALRLALGEAADALLDLQRVVPRRALEAGYGFTFPEIDGALGDLVRR